MEDKRPSWIVRAWWFLAYWLGFRHGIYYRWSRLYRWLYQRAYKGHVKTGPTLATLQQRARRFTWRRDDGRALRDAIGLPQHLEAYGFGDCDEFAAWWCDAGREGFSDSRGRTWHPVGILSVRWKEEGHNVALLGIEHMHDDRVLYSGFAHVSNWHDGRLFDGHRSIEDIAWHIAGLVDSAPLYLSLVSPDLKTLITHKWFGGKRG